MESAQLMKRTGLSPSTLSGQVAVITGAGRGIGREAARALAWLGARLVIAELDSISGEGTRALIEQAGGQAIFVQTDLADVSSIGALVAKTRSTYELPDILINNAILCSVAGVTEMEVALWDQVMAVNLRGAFLTCKAFLPEMLARQRGVIVNMISTEAMPGLAAYIAAKQGLTGFSQSLALEVEGQGVYVIPFAPGMVDTPGIRSVASGLAPRLGMSEEQFLSVPLHPAFEGLMPVEYAGAATACLVGALASEYHGEPVTGYTVLERVGLIQTASAPEIEALQAAARPAFVEELPALLADLSRVLAETQAEFERLPAFARPLAKGGFKRKSGASLADWLGLAAALQAGRVFPSDMPSRLDHLAAYYQDVPKETARFTRDPEVLKQVTGLCQRRIALIQRLKDTLPTHVLSGKV